MTTARPVAVALPTVKALVVHSPYAQRIADGTKPIEYRCWRTHYRGWLAIVAARRRESGSDAGRAVCLVKLTDCVQMGHKDFEWHLADPRQLPAARPILVPGRLGLFDVTDRLGPVAAALPASVAPTGARTPTRRVREIHRFLRSDGPYARTR